MLGDDGAAFADSVASLLSMKPNGPWEDPTSLEIAEAALQALGNMGAEGGKHVDLVFKFIDSKETYVASAAMLAVGNMIAGRVKSEVGGSTSGMVDAIAKKLRSTNPVIRANAASALASMGGEAVQYLDNLARCFEDRCPAVRASAIYAFPKLGKAGQIYAPLIAVLLADEASKVRIAAIHCLSSMGERGAALADEVALCMQDSDESVCAAAAAALAKYDNMSSKASSLGVWCRGT
jgi:HEAT repeat protein